MSDISAEPRSAVELAHLRKLESDVKDLYRTFQEIWRGCDHEDERRYAYEVLASGLAGLLGTKDEPK